MQWRSTLKVRCLIWQRIKACIRKGTIALDFFPTFCGSAFKNKGVQNVLNGVVDYLPDPLKLSHSQKLTVEGNETGEFARCLIQPSTRTCI